MQSKSAVEDDKGRPCEALTGGDALSAAESAAATDSADTDPTVVKDLGVAPALTGRPSMVDISADQAESSTLLAHLRCRRQWVARDVRCGAVFLYWVT